MTRVAWKLILINFILSHFLRSFVRIRRFIETMRCLFLPHLFFAAIKAFQRHSKFNQKLETVKLYFFPLDMVNLYQPWASFKRTASNYKQRRYNSKNLSFSKNYEMVLFPTKYSIVAKKWEEKDLMCLEKVDLEYIFYNTTD